MKLLRYGRPIATIFDLLGSKEDDMTYSLGYVAARSPRFASLLVERLAGERVAGVAEAVVQLQRIASEERGRRRRDPRRARVLRRARSEARSGAADANCFTEAGFEVLGAPDGAEAVAIATYRRPDAIVMDLQMRSWTVSKPHDAYARCTARGAYVLAVSPHAGDESRREAYEAGFDDLVTKRIAAPVLVSIVSATLRARES